MNYDSTETVSSTGTFIPCKHRNGWYDTVEIFGGLFFKRVFVCTDCYIILPRKVKEAE
uniref:Uncharacterized protein n=1 Tax=viral metagenome TaxID=1070528 RepID=A0A6H1ZP24_9ZZZZ